ncbi:MAG: hypothetical protein COA42_14865 [Alteromonadaceae bacterium]|nr:MAG: hypothetical protein COA42_14865 [Alteromonadaceae bacterium]
MSIIAQIKSQCIRLKILLALPALSCATALAGPGYPMDDYHNNYVGLSQEGTYQVQFTPTHLMDNETLFLAAAEANNNSMSDSLKVANNLWLMSGNKSAQASKKAVRNFFRVNILEMLRGPRKQKTSKTQPVSKTPQIANIDNYRVQLSNNKLRLKFNYRF